MSAQQQAVLIMGMHRSGTSCITGLLGAHGISVGPEDALMAATADNPRGYFENITFNKICVDLLTSSGADWWKVNNFDIANIPKEALKTAHEELGALIDSFKGTPTFALKDPRLCFLLPALRSLFPNPVFVHAVRSPIEVAMSLNKRNGFGMAEGIALWEAYNRTAFAATSQDPRVLINYGALVSEPEKYSAKLIEDLGQVGVSGLSLKKDATIADFVSKDLHRQKDVDHEADAFLTPSQKRLWAEMESGAFPTRRESQQSRQHRGLLLSCLEMQSLLQTARSLENKRIEEQKKREKASAEQQAEAQSKSKQQAEFTALEVKLNVAQTEIKHLAQAQVDATRTQESQTAEDQKKLDALTKDLLAETQKSHEQQISFAALQTGFAAAQVEIQRLAQIAAETARAHQSQRAEDQKKLDALNTQLQSELQRLAHAEAETARAHQSQRAEDQKKLDALNTQLQSELQRLAHAEADAARLTAQQRTDIQAKFDALTKELHTEIQRLERAEADIIRRSGQQRSEDQKKLATLSQKLQTETQKVHYQHTTLAALEDDFVAAQADLRRLSETEASTKRTLEELQEKSQKTLDSLNIEIQANAQKALEDKREQQALFAAAQAETNRLADDHKKLVALNTQLKTEAQTQQATFATAQTDIQRLSKGQEELNALNMQLKTTTQHHAKTQQETLASLETELSAAKAEIQQLPDLQRELSEVKDHCKRLEEHMIAEQKRSPYQKVKRLGTRPKHWLINKLNGPSAALQKKVKPDFDDLFYLSVNPDVRQKDMDPLLHYLRFGWKEGRRPHPRLDNSAFLRKHPEVSGNTHPQTPDPKPAVAKTDVKTDAKPADVSTKKSAALDAKPSPVATATPPASVPAAPVNSESLSYLATREQVLGSGFWDERWYLKHHANEFTAWQAKQEQGVLPIDHYLQVGWQAGYLPSRIFKCESAHDSGKTNPVTEFLTRKRPSYHFDENVWFPDQRTIQAYLDNKATRTATKVVYSCILNGYDDLVQPYYMDPDWDYVCFTDDQYLIDQGTVGAWEIREALHPEMRLDRRNRYHKMHPHEIFPNYKESIYIDGNINFLSSYLFDEIETRNLPIMLPKHFCRSCIYDEIKALVASHRTSDENREILPLQLEFLEKMNFPKDYGLNENNVIYRKHHNEVIKRVMARWWEVLCTFTSRDQLGMSYALWKEGITPADVSFPNTRFIYEDFWLFRHKKDAAAPGAVVIDEKIRPAFNDGCVPVALSCNEGFVGYLGIVLTSLIENTSDDRNYDIIVLQKDLSDGSKEKLGSLAKKNVSIRFYNVEPILEQLKDHDIHVAGYVPVETYNKCFLSEIMKGYDKVLYIDTDIVIRTDIAELYDTDLFGKALGASPNIANVHAAHQNTLIRERNFGDYLTGTLGVEKFEDYFQAGIIVLDMNSDKAKNLMQLSLDKLKEIKQPIFFDQCVFNSIFYGDVFFLSTTWNHVWYLQNYTYLKYNLPEDMFYDYANSRLDPKIVHFASGDKPTNKFDWKLSSHFWEYALKSPYADELMTQIEEQEGDTPTRKELCSEPRPRVLVHLHAYYEDQMDYFLGKLKNIHSVSWELLVTASDNFETMEKIVHAKFPTAKVMKVRNQGFDAYPFLQALRAKNLSHYDYVLKLHTKNARPDTSLVYGLPVPGHKWRDDMVDALLGSKEIFAANLAQMAENPTLGCIAAPQYKFSINENRERKTYNLRHWMNEFGLETGTHFIGGTMFMARSFPLERLKKFNPDELDFASGDKTSGSHKNLAHVTERLFGLVIENEGLSIEGPKDPG